MTTTLLSHTLPETSGASGRGLFVPGAKYESIYASASNVRGRFNGEPTNARVAVSVLT